MQAIRRGVVTLLLPEAARTGNARLVRYLLRQGAEPSPPTAAGPTPLQSAIAAGRGDVVLELLLAGVRT